MLIIFVGSITVYAYYLKEKTDELTIIKRGFCPKCNTKDSIEISDSRSSGCCGVKTITYECSVCGYTNIFQESSSGCGL
jgi:RNase P subunit RPR2